jgi:hypothetical protein
VRPFKNEALVLPSKRATLAGDYKIAAWMNYLQFIKFKNWEKFRFENAT